MNDLSILRSFGDLEHEQLGRKSGALERAGDGRGEIVLVQLSDRRVDRDIERALSAEREVPLADLRARPLEHPAAQRHDRPGLLGHADELSGGKPTPFRVSPAHQRLDPHDARRLQRDDRLVVDAIDQDSELVAA